jgi:hypothetical protein
MSMPTELMAGPLMTKFGPWKVPSYVSALYAKDLNSRSEGFVGVI